MNTIANKPYHTILVAVELNPDEDSYIIEKAKYLATQHDATLHLVHAIENINSYGAASAYPAIADIEEELLKEHKISLANLGQQLNVPESRQYLDMGSPAAVIADCAKKFTADLIIVGSHSRHGLAALLGSTADSLLHRAECDILAVRLPA